MLDFAVAGRSDFAYMLASTSIGQGRGSRVGLAALGALVYALGVRTTSRYAPAGTSFGVAYVAIGAVTCAAALFYAGPTLPAVKEAALESFGAMAGLLRLAIRANDRHQSLQVKPTGLLFIESGSAVAAFRPTLGVGMR